MYKNFRTSLCTFRMYALLQSLQALLQADEGRKLITPAHGVIITITLIRLMALMDLLLSIGCLLYADQPVLVQKVMIHRKNH